MAGLWSVLKYGSDTRSCAVLRLCGRAPGRALFSGHRGSGSMDRAWVGPLYWIQWAGGHRHLHPRGWRTGPGGALCLPGCAQELTVCEACTERVHTCPRVANLAENRPRIHTAITAPTTALEGANGVFGAHGGGAFTSQSPWSAGVSGPPGRPREGERPGAFRGSQAAPRPLHRAFFMAAW